MTLKKNDHKKLALYLQLVHWQEGEKTGDDWQGCGGGEASGHEEWP